MNPSEFVPVKSEVVYLLDLLDADRSKDLTLSELVTDETQREIFLMSQMSYFGQIYEQEHLREKIFHVVNLDYDNSV